MGKVTPAGGRAKRHTVQCQTAFDFAKRKRRKKGAPPLGRPARADRAGCVPHAKRPSHDKRHPLHVTATRAKGLPSFRAEIVYRQILHVLGRAKARGIRVIEHDVLDNHLHLLAEAEDNEKLSNGLRWLFSQIAFAVNALLRRRGAVFHDRHHRRPLTTPRAVRNALVYVLMNGRKHCEELTLDERKRWIDPCSSMMWFERWHVDASPPANGIGYWRFQRGESPLSKPQSWLATIGWLRGGGPLRFDELPAAVR